MNYKRNEKQNGVIKIDFELNAKEWEAEVEKAYQKNKGKYKKEGFRQGKVPRKVLENTYGEYLFYEDAFNDCFPEYFSKMLNKEKDIIPVDYPDVKVSKMDADGISFSATITLLPEFKLPKYTGHKVERKKIAVIQSEITKEIEALRQKNARFIEITDRPIKNGDLINLDYSGSVEGKKFEGGTAKDQELEIGSKSFIPGFEEQMIGLKIGEEKDLKVVFPDKYHSKDLAGKEAVFSVKVLSIREKQLPALDDAFVKDVTEFSSLTELSLDIESKLAAQKDKQADRAVEEALISKIVDAADFEIPEVMIEKQLDYYVSDLEKRLSYQGMNKETYFEYIGKTEAEFKKDRRNDAKKTVKTSLLLEEIIKQEKLKVTDKDLDAKFEEIAKIYSRPVEEIKKHFAGNELSSIKQEILSDKVINFLKDNNTITSAK